MWTRVAAWVASIGFLVALVGTCTVAINKDINRREASNTVKRANVLLMEKSEHGYHYNIYLDGFGSEDWRTEMLKLTIDKTIPKGEPSALFGYNTFNQGIRDYIEIVISFHDREDLVKFMGSSGMNVNIQSGRDANVAVSQSKSNSDSCFISAMGGGKDETYILR